MSAQHTPGPWTYHPDSGSSCAALIATGSFVCEFIEAPNEANARLIAAAPELLGALRMLLATAGEINDAPDGLLEMALESDDQETRNQANAHLCARAAIAKVTGEQT